MISDQLVRESQFVLPPKLTLSNAPALIVWWWLLGESQRAPPVAKRTTWRPTMRPVDYLADHIRQP